MTLVFIHGAGCAREVFDAQLREFEGAHAPNLPGHLCGGSPETIAEFADSVVEYVANHLLDGIVLCGHSMGGAVALTIALRRPPWLAGVAALGSGGRMRVAPAFLSGLERDFKATARTIAGFFYADRAPERIDAAVRMMECVGQAQTLRDFRACDAFDVLDRLGEVAIPLLAVTGEADELAPPKFAQALADRVPGAEARIIPGGGHFVMVERPAETNSAIASFASGLS